ncbi:MAG: 4-hydroxy-3-methylbut-2-enyl diphosphate reductase [Bacteroidia bacterium]|nr:4-hydroxy-3-methylbut-2-enyl diphosphate reductase [Bacteroidota bacterium]MBP7269994.1 4-hydroxy-3-methylbut-2-enyl diphosphate reductase [Bacteroidia bacterium]MBP7728914.1 4-hydroxy-3-methylbut-2-enyl diphosphate reductase [Bacteroidia bacterium]MBP7772570.1 4-hydroxy-3-methylbut-2-enyl diphosphate reductase [Bacteroidia bacterium]
MQTLPRLRLTVTIDPGSGFCFGVVYAIQLAEEILAAEGRLFCLGDIVHNDAEIERLRQKGLRTITHDELRALRDVHVLIRAHGEPPSTYQIAIENNLTLIDASCPVVLKLQNRVRQSADEERDILIYGKRGHAEVEGLIGQVKAKNVIVFQSLEELDFDTLPRSVSLYSQTTKSTEKFYRIYEALTARGIEVELNDTTCRQVSNRDQQLRQFAAAFDKIVFVSGIKSSNGKVLYDVCKAVNNGTFFVSRPDEVQAGWFSPNDRVGICGATSTPMWLMEAVRDRLHSF